MPKPPADPLAGLLACLAGRPPAETDWPLLLAAANRALVTGLLADRIGGSAPEDVRAFLAAVRARIAERNARLDGQLAQAVAALNRAGIEPVLLKGAAIVRTIGPSYAGRILSDLDLMVPAEAMARSVQCLAGLGYREHAPSGLEDGPRNLFRPEDVGMIDLHGRTKVRHPGIGYRELAADAAPLMLGTARARLPSPAMQMLLIVLHDQLQERDYWRGLVDLRHLLDLDALARLPGGIDWAVVADRFPRGYPGRALAVQLLTVETLFSPGIPPALLGGAWPRLQVRRRLAQLRRPWLRIPLTLLSWLADPPFRAGLSGPRATPIEHSRLAASPLPQPVRHAVAAASRFLQTPGPGKL